MQTSSAEGERTKSQGKKELASDDYLNFDSDDSEDEEDKRDDDDDDDDEDEDEGG